MKVLIDFSPLRYQFVSKPLLVGGKALEYWSIRKAGTDIDCVISAEDYHKLSRMYPDNLKNLVGDCGVCIYGFELWKTILLYDYQFLSRNAVMHDSVYIASLETLIFMKAIALKDEKYSQKYHDDLLLLVDRLISVRYPKK